jgi:hypothetical protein
MRSRGDVGRELCRCGISVSRPQFSSFVPEFLFFEDDEFGKLKVLFMYLAFSFHVKGTTDDFVFKVFVLLCYSEIILIILINLA